MTEHFLSRLRRYLQAFLIGVPTLALVLYSGSLLLFDPGFARSSEFGCAALEWAALRWPPIQNSAAVRILVAPLAHDPSGTFTATTKSALNQKLRNDPRVQIVEHCRPVQPIGIETRPKKQIAIQNADKLLNAYNADAIVWGQVRHANGRDVLDIRIQIPGDDGGQEVDGSGVYTVGGPELRLDSTFSADAGLAIYAQIFSNLQAYLAQRSDKTDGPEEVEYWKSRRDYYAEVIRYDLVPTLVSSAARLKELAKVQANESLSADVRGELSQRFSLLYSAVVRIVGTTFETLRDLGSKDDAISHARLLDGLFTIKPEGLVSDFCECLEGSVNFFLAESAREELAELEKNVDEGLKEKKEVKKREIAERFEKAMNNFGAAASLIVREKSTEAHLRWAHYKGNEGLSAQERFWTDPDVGFANRAIAAYNEAIAIEMAAARSSQMYLEEIGVVWWSNKQRINSLHFNVMNAFVRLLIEKITVNEPEVSDEIRKLAIKSADFVIQNSMTVIRRLDQNDSLSGTLEGDSAFSLLRPSFVFQSSVAYLRQAQLLESEAQRKKAATSAKEGFKQTSEIAKERLRRKDLSDTQRVSLERIAKEAEMNISVSERLIAGETKAPDASTIASDLWPAVSSFAVSSMTLNMPFTLQEPSAIANPDPDIVMEKFWFKKKRQTSSVPERSIGTHPASILVDQ